MSDTVSAVILCGGKSSRMGFDKSLLKIRNQYLIEEVYCSLSTIFSNVSLITNDPKKFDPLLSLSNVEKIKDNYFQKGPLGGICTALESIGTEWLFICACDWSYIDVESITKLNQFRKNNQVVIYRHGNYLETLFAFYHKSCLPHFLKQLKAGNGRPADSFKHLIVQELDFPNETNVSKMVNLNTQDDLKNLKTIMPLEE